MKKLRLVRLSMLSAKRTPDSICLRVRGWSARICLHRFQDFYSHPICKGRYPTGGKLIFGIYAQEMDLSDPSHMGSCGAIPGFLLNVSRTLHSWSRKSDMNLFKVPSWNNGLFPLCLGMPHRLCPYTDLHQGFLLRI